MGDARFELRRAAVRAAVDPERGFEITALSVGGAQVLAAPGWDRAQPTPLASQQEWVAAWGGGWQLAFPNAGAPAPRARCPQGYHGAASQTPWGLTGRETERASARWEDPGGLIAERVIALTDNGVIVRTSVDNAADQPRPIVATEHLALGSDLLAGAAVIDAGGAEGRQLDGAGAAAGPYQPWPGGGEPDWSVARVGLTPARDIVLRNVGEHGVTVAAPGIDVRVTWDVAVLPHMWLWQELAATTDAPWNGATRALGIEPATTPHGLGLDAASDGDGPVLAPGERLTWWVRLGVGVPARTVIG